MTYLGNPPVNGVFKKLDNISGSFNGTTTTFNLTSGGAATTPGLAQNLIISLGGIIQEPGSAFTISGSTITFTAAPASYVSFWGIQLGGVGLATNPNQSAMTTQTFTATAGQVTFTVAGGYTAGQLQVFQNGVQLVVGTDVTASNGTTFVLTNAANSGDTLVAISYSSFIAANAVAKSGDTMSGDLTVQTSAYLATVSGNVGIGTSSPTVYGSYKTLEVRGTGGGLVQFGTGATTAAYLYQDGTNAGFTNIANGVMTFSTNNAERMRIDTSGNLLVGRTSLVTPSGLSTVNVQSSSGFSAYNGTNAAQYAIDRINFNSSNFYVLNASSVGVVLVSGNTSWSAQSDERLKDIIEPIANAVDKVSTLRAVIGRYKTDNDSRRRAFLMAQDVQAVLPEAVSEDADGHLLLGYSETIPLLVAAIQELKTDLDAAKAEIEVLKGK
jgi:hypothetical protein